MITSIRNYLINQVILIHQMSSTAIPVYKIVVLGDTNSGKIELIQQFVAYKHVPNFLSTIGVDFKVKTIEISNKFIKLQIWDMAGQERFRAITAAHYKNAQGFIIVFNCDKVKSFENVKMWHQQCSIGGSNIPIILIGIVPDPNSNCSYISESQATSLANELNISLFMVHLMDRPDILAAPFNYLAGVIEQRIDALNPKGNPHAYEDFQMVSNEEITLGKIHDILLKQEKRLDRIEQILKDIK
jgi:Ras-related protein Rab-8A